jgi:hypothetical protein
MARNNFWNDVVAGMQVGQKMMNDSERAGRESREFERKEKAWEQEDAVDSALSNAPKEVSVVAPKYKLGDQEFNTLEEASKTAELLNASGQDSGQIQPADANGKAISGWKEAAKSDQYKDAVKTLQSKGYGLAADKVHAEYGKAVAQELKKAINGAAATGDWSDVMSIYNSKVGDNFDGRMEKGADGKLNFYAKGKDGQERLTQTFDNNADAAAYYSSIEDGKLHDYWKTSVVNKELAQQKLAQQQQRIEEQKRHNQTLEALRGQAIDARGAGRSGSSSGSKAKTGSDQADGPNRFDNKETLNYLNAAVPEDGFSDPKAKVSIPKAQIVEQANSHLSRLRAMNPSVPDDELASVALDSVRRGNNLQSGGEVAYKLDGKGNFVPTVRYKSDTGIREYTVDKPVSVEQIGSSSNGLAKPDAETMKLANRQFATSTLSQLQSMQRGLSDPAYKKALTDKMGWKFVENINGEIEKWESKVKDYDSVDSESRRNASKSPMPAGFKPDARWSPTTPAMKTAGAESSGGEQTTTRAGKFFGDIAENRRQEVEQQRQRLENDPIRKKFSSAWDYLFKDQVPR